MSNSAVAMATAGLIEKLTAEGTGEPAGNKTRYMPFFEPMLN